MQIFLTGANGYIGGAVAAALVAGGHRVRGLVRDRAKAEVVAAHGIEPVIGLLDDAALLADEARAADAVVNAANSDHRGAVEASIARACRFRQMLAAFERLKHRRRSGHGRTVGSHLR